MEFHVGQKVKIKKGLSIGSTYMSETQSVRVRYTRTMDSYKGRVGIVTKVDEMSGIYKLDLNDYYSWCSDMLERAEYNKYRIRGGI